MKSQSIRVSLVVLLVISVAIPMLAQSKTRSSSTKSKSGSKTAKTPPPTSVPSIDQETKDFILENTQLKREKSGLAALLGNSSAAFAFEQHVRFDGCKMIWSGRDDLELFRFVDEAVTLGDLDQDEIAIGSDSFADDKTVIRVKCSSAKPNCVACKQSNGYSFTTNQFVFHATEIPRVVRAIADAINSCGGKKRRY